MTEYKNSKKQGDWGLGRAIAYFTKLGKPVSLPLTDSQDYDLIVEAKSGKLLKIQVKTTTYKERNTFVVGLRTCGGNTKKYTSKSFTENDSHYLFVVTSDQTCYLIPKKKIKATNALSLGSACKKWCVV